MTASSQAPLCFGAGPHRGTYSWLCVPPDTTCSKRFFRDCFNGPAICCEMVLNQTAFLWQFYSKRVKRMKYQTKIILSECILWKTLLGNAYYGKLTYQVLKYSLGRAACYKPVPFSESCQSSMTLSEGKKHSHSFKITCVNRRLGLLESSQYFRVASGLAKLINSFGPHHS